MTAETAESTTRGIPRELRWDAAYESPRGNPDKNDTYGTLQITASKVVMGSSNFRRNNYNSKRRTVKRRPSKPGSSRMGRGRAKF